eukprot:3935681-Rhodomonas_salina.1
MDAGFEVQGQDGDGAYVATARDAVVDGATASAANLLRSSARHALRRPVRSRNHDRIGVTPTATARGCLDGARV